MMGGMHIAERLGGARVACRGGCRLRVHGETGLLVPPAPRGTCSPFLWRAGELWGCGMSLLHTSVCTCGWGSPGEPLRQRSELLRLGLAAGKAFRGSRGWSWDG